MDYFTKDAKKGEIIVIKLSQLVNWLHCNKTCQIIYLCTNFTSAYLIKKSYI